MSDRYNPHAMWDPPNRLHCYQREGPNAWPCLVPPTTGVRKARLRIELGFVTMLTLYGLLDLASVLNGCFIGVPLKGTPTVIGEIRGP